MCIIITQTLAWLFTRMRTMLSYYVRYGVGVAVFAVDLLLWCVSNKSVSEVIDSNNCRQSGVVIALTKADLWWVFTWAMSELETGGGGRAETTIKLKICESILANSWHSQVYVFPSRPPVCLPVCVCVCAAEAKNLPPPHELRHSRDCYIVAALDQEEIFRTATVEKSLR